MRFSSVLDNAELVHVLRTFFFAFPPPPCQHNTIIDGSRRYQMPIRQGIEREGADNLIKD